MRLLAIETSCERGSLALLDGDTLLSHTADAGGPHSSWVLPEVRRLLADGGLTLRELDAIAYGAGPGGFTGLRLACGITQGLAFGAGLPVIGIGSLEALAFASGRSRCYVALDARMNEVYFAAYLCASEDIETVIAPGVAAPAQVPVPPGGGWHGCGSGFGAYAGALWASLGEAIGSSDDQAIPHAGYVARLAAARCNRCAQDASQAQPLYVRDKVALTTTERLARG